MGEELFVWQSDSSSIEEFELGLTLAKNSAVTGLLILACHENHFTAQQINPLICHCKLPIFGGIYPKLVYRNQLMQQGWIMIGFNQTIDVTLVTNVSELSDDKKLEQAIDETAINRSQHTTNDSFLMFYDALINNIEPFIDCLFEYLDHQINIIGGGAGNLDFIKSPCIFTNQGLLNDVVQLVSLPNKLTMGVGHGWNILQGPFLVSESEKQTVMSINYSPAFNVYKEEIERVSEYVFAESNFFDIAKHFPLGIEDVNNQLVVRDPILTHDGFIQCVGNIPVNSMVYLLEGSLDSLFNSAQQAAKLATNNTDEDPFSASMLFDCISRVLYMEDNFKHELDLIAERCTEQAFFGVLFLGEIANNQSGVIKLLNKSTVIGSW